MNYNLHLQNTIRLARLAGQVLLAEFHRPGGPRGSSGHCQADVEAETIIRDGLEAIGPDDGIVGEELRERDRPRRKGSPHLWVIDPNDGTSAFQKGWRGAAVSIALLRDGVPVLGVVHAYAENAGAGDCIAWAEGELLTRNGGAIDTAALPATALRIVAVSQDADEASEANAELAAPLFRFRAVPGIAYRLALVAVGEAVAGVSINAPVIWDVLGGHALLRGAGGDLYRLGGGGPVRYDADGRGEIGCCVGGFAPEVHALAKADWTAVRRLRPTIASVTRKSLYPLRRPDPRALSADAPLLGRAQGCLLGQLAGDSLGSLVEFRDQESILEQYPQRPQILRDGGTWSTLAGQPTDDSEMALMLARTIASTGSYDVEAVARAYCYWAESGPFDMGMTTRNALLPPTPPGESAAETVTRRAATNPASQANGALMRISPLAIWGHRLEPEKLAEYARRDAALTHSSLVCGDAKAVYCHAIAALLQGVGGDQVYAETVAWAKQGGLQSSVITTLEKAGAAPPRDCMSQQGWVLIALQNAFHEMLRADSLAEGVIRTVTRGGDTDTNGAIAGALLGARFGLEGIPAQWKGTLLSCRPLVGVKGCMHPRPKCFWPVDALHLAEALLVQG